MPDRMEREDALRMIDPKEQAVIPNPVFPQSRELFGQMPEGFDEDLGVLGEPLDLLSHPLPNRFGQFPKGVFKCRSAQNLVRLGHCAAIPVVGDLGWSFRITAGVRLWP